MRDLQTLVLGALAWSHARTVSQIAERLTRARVRVEHTEIEDALLELEHTGQVEVSDRGWTRT